MNRLLLLAVLLAGPTRAEPPGDSTVFRDCDQCPEMVVIPPGSFQMGPLAEEGPDHEDEDRGARVKVTIPAAFALGRAEVTRGQFRTFIAATGHEVVPGCTKDGGERHLDIDWRDPGYPQDDDHPAVCIAYPDAVAYTRWLSAHTGASYRLPTEAEWEYAARAGTNGDGFWAGGWDQACPYVNSADLTARQRRYGDWHVHGVGMVTEAEREAEWAVRNCHDGFVNTAPVASLRPNPFGLHDMLGNAWEWVADCWHTDHAEIPNDGSAYTEPQCAVGLLRGGAWFDQPWEVRVNERVAVLRDANNDADGFRVARDLP